MNQRVRVLSLSLVLVGGGAFLFLSGLLGPGGPGTGSDPAPWVAGDPSDPDDPAFWQVLDEAVEPGFPGGPLPPSAPWQPEEESRRLEQPQTESRGPPAPIRVRISADGSTRTEVMGPRGMTPTQIVGPRRPGYDGDPASDRAIAALIAILKEQPGVSVEIHLAPHAPLEYGLALLWLPSLVPVDGEIALFIGEGEPVWTRVRDGDAMHHRYDSVYAGASVLVFRKNATRPYTKLRFDLFDGRKTFVTAPDPEFSAVVARRVHETGVTGGDAVRIAMSPAAHGLSAGQFASILTALRSIGVDRIDIHWTLPRYVSMHLEDAAEQREQRRLQAEGKARPDPATSERPGAYLQFHRDGTITARTRTPGGESECQISGWSDGVEASVRERNIVERLGPVLRAAAGLPISLHARSRMRAHDVLSVASVAALLDGQWKFTVYVDHEAAFTFSVGRADRSHLIDASSLSELVDTGTRRDLRIDRERGGQNITLTTSARAYLTSVGLRSKHQLAQAIQSDLKNVMEPKGTIRLVIGRYTTLGDVAAALVGLTAAGVHVGRVGIPVLEAVRRGL